MSLAERAGLCGLVRRHVQITAKAGVHPDLKVACLVAGMAAGAGSIADMGAPRGALPVSSAERARTGVGIRGPDGLPGSVRKEGP